MVSFLVTFFSYFLVTFLVIFSCLSETNCVRIFSVLTEKERCKGASYLCAYFQFWHTNREKRRIIFVRIFAVWQTNRDKGATCLCAHTFSFDRKIEKKAHHICAHIFSLDRNEMFFSICVFKTRNLLPKNYPFYSPQKCWALVCVCGGGGVSVCVWERALARPGKLSVWHNSMDTRRRNTKAQIDLCCKREKAG
jgi:hypothetical protein